MSGIEAIQIAADAEKMAVHLYNEETKKFRNRLCENRPVLGFFLS